MSANERLAEIGALLAPLGITLLPEQPHIGGERVIQSESRLVLLGSDRESTVVIKASWKPEAIEEGVREKEAREVLETLPFAENEMHLPQVLFAGMRGCYFLYITRFIPQERVFVTLPLEEQFFLALNAFETQEAFHATTFEHNQRIKKTFEVYTADTYLTKFREYMRVCEAYPGLAETLKNAYALLSEHKTVIARYMNYLIHNDFVPHNMRLVGRNLYVLDLAAFWFGNKYEGWARFANYMLHHNPALERKIVEFVRENRPDEYLAFRLMRAYKLGMLLAYYVGIYPKTEGDHRLLTEVRITYWKAMLEDILADRPPSEEAVATYLATRDRLRSEEEKQRQREFAIA